MVGFSPGIAALLLVTSVTLIGVFWWSVLRRPVHRPAACNDCGYPVGGLESMTCPECGSDLRVIGIAPARRRFVPPALFVPVWILLATISGLSGWVLVRAMIPRTISISSEVSLGDADGSGPDVRSEFLVRSRGPGDRMMHGASTHDSSRATDRRQVTVLFPHVDGSPSAPVRLTLSRNGTDRRLEATAPVPPSEVVEWFGGESAPGIAEAFAGLSDSFFLGESVAVCTGLETRPSAQPLRLRSSMPVGAPVAYGSVWLAVLSLGLLVFRSQLRGRVKRLSQMP